MKRTNTLARATRTGFFSLVLTAAVTSQAARAAGPSGNWLQFPIPPATQAPSGRAYASGIFDPNNSSLTIFGGYPFALADTWSFALAGPGGWTPKGTLGTCPGRWGHAGVYDPVRNRMIVMGGYDNGGGTQFNTVYALSLSGPAIWTQITPAGTPPPGRRNHFMVYDPVRDRLLVVGGYVDGLSFQSDVWELNLSGSPTWTHITPAGTAPTGRSMVYGVYDPVRDRLVLFGGWDGTSYLNELWQLNLTGTPTWTPLASTGTAPTPRRDGGVVYDAANDRLVMFGGRDATGARHEVFGLSLSGTPNWSSIAPAGPLPDLRYSFTTALDPVNNRMVVFGGYAQTADADVNDVWGLSLGAGTETWTKLFVQTVPPSPNCDYAMAFDPVRNRQVLYGGKVTGSETWLWQLGGTPQFTRLITQHRPTRRASSEAVYDVANDRMLMFGGYDNDFFAYRNDLWQLGGFTGTPDWTLVPATGPYPSPRLYNSQIVDPVRQRMVVFGGTPVELNDVWAIPLSGPPQWLQLFPAGTPPPARWGHNAVYDAPRDRMIVFGGFGGGDRNDIWALRFTPTLQWVQLLPPGPLPAPRRSATMVYDSNRDRILLYGGGTDNLGGTSNTGLFADVWEFTPGIDRWTQLTPGGGGPPEARNQMMASYEALADRMAFYGGWDFHFLSDAWFLNFEQPTAALATLVRAERGEDGVSLEWTVGENSDPPVAIERSLDGGTSWSRAVDVVLDSRRRIEWTDRDAPLDARVGYRLAFAGTAGTISAGEAWVEARPLAFAIRSIGPNPAVERVAVRFSVPARQAASLEVFDLAGRRVLKKDLGSIEAGEHRIALDGLGSLRAGVYQVRLHSGADIAAARLMLVH